MVYSGYPSKACAECRLRRTKCDTLRPSCSQCVRAGRKCRGYREVTDMIFRDESAGQIVKHQRRKAATSKSEESKAKSRTSTPKTSQAITNKLKPLPNQTSNPDSTSYFPDVGLQLSAEDQAACYFFQNYVLEGDQFIRSHFQCLSDVYLTGVVGPALSDSITAVGMAGMAQLCKSSEIMEAAQFKYGSALRQVCAQLKNPEDVGSDQTLITVLLLGLFETNTCNSRHSMASWTKHIGGATTLLQLRGKKLLETPTGHQLFLYIRTQIITNCIQKHEAVPASISEWSKVLPKQTPEELAATDLCELAIRYCNLRAGMEGLHDFSNSGHIVSTACALDDDYASWHRNCPVEYNYNTVNVLEPSQEIFAEFYHTYPNVRVATIWNHYRAVRILLNELILGQIYHLFPCGIESTIQWDNCSFFETQLLSSHSTITKLSSDICASVPYFLGYDVESKQTVPGLPKAVNGNMILWPLYVAGGTNMISDAMKCWVVGRLHWVSENMGIRQAESLALLLDINLDLMDWQVGHCGETDQTEFLPWEI